MNPNIILPGAAGLRAGQVAGGEMPYEAIAELRKALTAGYGSDVSTLTGGAALRIQSLEKTMLSTIQENKHFALFNRLAKTNAIATVDEWTEQSGVGGFLGGSTNTETGSIAAATGSYNRRVGLVKYLMTRREVSFVQTLQGALADSEAVEAQNGALQLLTDAEFLSFEGDSTIVATEFDGINAQLNAGIATGDISGDHVLDANASSLSSIDLINKSAAIIAGFGNFGTPTDIFMSQLVQSDFDTGLDPAFRVPLTDVPGGGISIGSPVVGIRTSWGNIKTSPDVFVRDEGQMKPFEVDFSAIAAANAGMQPTITSIVTSGTDANSNFTAATAGNYFYLITGLNQSGQSTGVVSTQQAIAAGKKAVITIAASGGGLETGYAIYRSRLNGTNNVSGVAGVGSDFRLMTRVARTASSTVYNDLNRDIPGTTKAYILNLSPGAQAITWRQLLPMLKFPLYPTVSATVPWAQLLFGFLRIGKRRHHIVIKNILTNGAVWRPFN